MVLGLASAVLDVQFARRRALALAAPRSDDEKLALFDHLPYDTGGQESH